SQASTVLATVKPKHIHRISRQRSVISYSREHVSTGLESSGGVLYTTASEVLHCTGRYKAWMQLLAMETHSMMLSMHCSANLKTT
ncbi:unnamed protein product, partial [Staurois parvus]